MSKIDYDLRLVRAAVFDVDGVLSPSTVPLGTDGMPQRMVNVKDGYALQHAVKTGLKICLITGADSPAVALRYHALGIRDIFQKASLKLPVLQQWCHQEGLIPEMVAYVGDDVPDLPCIRWAGLSVAPADADSAVRMAARYISPAKGGYGVARDLLEELMRAQGTWLDHAEAFGW